MSSNMALVTGASRGVGKGIAVALGRAGWTVWVTGRSSLTGPRTTALPGTVEETARAVRDAGGHGIPVRCDHRDDTDVLRLAARLEDEAGELGLLVNNVWGGFGRRHAGAVREWDLPYWRQPLVLWDSMLDSVRAHYVTTVVLSPLLMRTPGSLIVTVSADAGRRHRAGDNVPYSVAKAADDRLAVAVAAQLAGQGVASVALHPADVRTEGTPRTVRLTDPAATQSPEGVGRVVAALTTDPELRHLSGTVLDVSALAVRYGLDIHS
ncbi:MAG: SDR family NAD(P)-dependent oxidoreductase [Streptosporangiales bacterium]|nr:SDR family NAD(P)-dependent oxidoreductase [Streptosporangiales bacterium]